jgi:hypothetical protein
MRKKKTHILILDKDDPKRELEFEIRFMLSLTQAERYKLMERLVSEGLKQKKRNGYKATPSIVTRP